MKWKGNSQLDWAWHGFDLGVTVHYLDGFHEKQKPSFRLAIPYPNGFKEHYVKETWFFDVRGTYTFNLVPPVETSPVPGYAKDSKDTTGTQDGKAAESATAQTASYGLPTWKRLLNGTTITLGCNNVFGHDPPTAASRTNYADFIYDSTGRFVYLSLTKRF